jgi:hypothetical protein
MTSRTSSEIGPVFLKSRLGSYHLSQFLTSIAKILIYFLVFFNEETTESDAVTHVCNPSYGKVETGRNVV